MTELDLEQLLKKFREGACSEEELASLEAWYAEWHMDDHVKLTETGLRKAESLMRAQVMKRIGMKTVRLWPRIALIAASLVLMTGLGVYLFRSGVSGTGPEKTAPAVADILPGKSGATLTLANGRRIRLDKAERGQLARQGGINISKSDDGEVAYTGGGAGEVNHKPGGDSPGILMNTLTTAKGETFKIKLPDGSMVWLNAGSELTFPADMLTGNERDVRLSGEGYFEVAKDASRPFVVRVPGSPNFSGQEIRVLGTHFNVSSYPEERHAATTLLEGKISLKAAGVKSGRILTPGQQADLVSSDIRVSMVDTTSAVAWKNGYFYFDHSDIRSVMNQISRWYDVGVVYEGKLPASHITGKVHRSANLSEALQILKYLDINYSMSGRTIKVRP